MLFFRPEELAPQTTPPYVPRQHPHSETCGLGGFLVCRENLRDVTHRPSRKLLFRIYKVVSPPPRFTRCGMFLDSLYRTIHELQAALIRDSLHEFLLYVPPSPDPH